MNETDTAPTYYPTYEPKDAEKFRCMTLVFANAVTHAELKQISLLYIFDMSYAREDILVALGRIEKSRGWR